MSNKDTRKRVASAFQAMKDIGITEDKVKPVLKNLLKLYDKNWVLIEEENYRALADAIFERDEAEAAEASKKTVVNQTKDSQDEEALATEQIERPLKRLRPRYQEGQTSSNTPLVLPKEEPCDIPENSAPQRHTPKAVVESPQSNSQAVTRQSLGKSKGKQPVYPTPLTIREGGDIFPPSNASKSQLTTHLRAHSRSQSQSQSESYPMKLREQGTEAASLQVLCGEKGVRPNNSGNALNMKVLKDEPITNNAPCSELPGVTSISDASIGVDPENMEGVLMEYCTREPLPVQSVSEKEAINGSTALNPPRTNEVLPGTAWECSSNLEIASLPSGEVKIILNCEFPPGSFDFHMPNLEAVLNFVEDKCLRSLKTPGPNISTAILMKEICECFLKLGTESNTPSKIIGTMTPALDLASEISDKDSLGTRGTCNSSPNGLIDSQSGSEVPNLHTRVLRSSCNGKSGGPQLNKMGTADKGSRKRRKEETSSPSLKVVHQPKMLPDNITSPLDVFDVAKGREKVAITIVNQVNNDLPSPFYYIPQNAPFQNAHLNFSLARIGDKNCCAACSGDCLSSSTPCACAHKITKRFAYTSDGLIREEFLKECVSMKRTPTKSHLFFCKECLLERSKCEDIIEPCKGHLQKKFIKECWWKCGCNKQCGNRVVQRGISCKLEVFMTPDGRGWGLRTLQDLPKGAFVCEYVGEVLTIAELYERVRDSLDPDKYSNPVLLDADWRSKGRLKADDALCLDATNYGNVGRFINHRCYDASLLEIPVEVETPDHSYYRVAFFTTREVKAMEELTWDYGIDFDDHDNPIKPFSCQCGSKFCRKMKRYGTRSGKR